MKTEIDLKSLQEGVGRLKRDQPELFAYLEQRDALLVQALLHVASRIPDPEDLPDMQLPFADLFETSSCNSYFQPNAIRDDLEIDVPESFLRLARRAEWLCGKGIVLRKTRLGELVER